MPSRALPGYVDQEIALCVAGKRSSFDVCRISYRKTGIHFSGKCSNVDLGRFGGGSHELSMEISIVVLVTVLLFGILIFGTVTS
jgi:hypothetical protein